MKKLIALLLGLAIIVFIYVGFYFAEISCPIKFLTGISCAGCGMTRACVSALFGDFGAAFYFHPLWFLMPIAVLWLLALYFFDLRRAMNICLTLLSLLLLAVYIVRFFTTPELVSFNPEESIFYKLFQ